MKIFKTFKLKLISLLSLFIGGIAGALVLSCVAWFTTIDRFEPFDVYSSIITSYFDSGKGTSAEPYVITRPIHYWNLIYLQESDMKGFADGKLVFQMGKDMDGDGTYEFYEYDDNGVLQYLDGDNQFERTSKYLNMNYYQGEKAVLPLGSATNPFCGEIRGHDLTIKNLHINGDNRSDIGIFGYCDANANVHDLYFQNVDIDIKTPKVTEMGTHNPTHTTTANIGYLCGHVYNADNSFNNVYLNNCEIYNSVASSGQYDILNTFSYFGRVDVVEPIPTETAQYRADVDPNSIFTYFNDNYSSIQGKDYKSRNTEYATELTLGKVSDAVSRENSGNSATYKIKKDYKNGWDSTLSTGGYASGETVVKNLRYNINGNFNKLSSTTTEIDHAPTTTDEDGNYVYWDTTKSRWQYSIVTSSQSSVSYIDYNCFTVSYVANETTTYYWLFDNNNLTVTTVSPSEAESAGNATDNYYFVFKDIEGSKGVQSLRSTDEANAYYIYSPANQAYLTQGTDEGVLTFTTEFGSATQFTIKGPETTFGYRVNSNDRSILLDEGSVSGTHTSAIKPATIWNIGSILEEPDASSAVYNLVTDVNDITDNSVIAITNAPLEGGGIDTRAMSTAQNENNRGVTDITINGDSIAEAYFSNVPNLAEFIVKHQKDANGNVIGFAFYDKSYKNNTGGYLYSAGTRSTKTNYLRTQETLDNKGVWDVQIDTKGIAMIKSIGNDNVPYIRYNGTASFEIFSCYNSNTNYVSPSIFIRDETGLGGVKYSDSMVRQYESASSSNDKTITNYDLYVGSKNTVVYTQLFTVERTNDTTVIFNFSESTVQYTGTAKDSWTKVTNVNALLPNDEIIIAASNYDYALGQTQNSNNRAQAAITKTDNDLSWDDGASEKPQIITLGKEGDNFTFYCAPENSTTPGYLYAASSSSNHLRTQETNDANGQWKITINNNNNGEATITAQGTNANNVLRYNPSGKIFSCYTGGQQLVTIYKHYVDEGSDATYYGDQISGYYNPSVVDVVGEANITSSKITFPSINSFTTVAGNIDEKFYASKHTDNGVVIYVDNNGSRDLGTISVEYSVTGGADLVLASSRLSTVETTTFENAGCRDLDTSTPKKYMLNLNINNIKKLAFCALDDNGAICATYTSDGASNPGSKNVIPQKYVIYLASYDSAATGSIALKKARYEFTQAPGNVGDFGTVGYRSAVYNQDGTLNTTASTVSGTELNFYFLVSDENVSFRVRVVFDHTNSRFDITFTSNQACKIYLFNYEGNAYDIYVNGNITAKGMNEIQINAS